MKKGSLLLAAVLAFLAVPSWSGLLVKSDKDAVITYQKTDGTWETAKRGDVIPDGAVIKVTGTGRAHFESGGVAISIVAGSFQARTVPGIGVQVTPTPGTFSIVTVAVRGVAVGVTRGSVIASSDPKQPPVKAASESVGVIVNGQLQDLSAGETIAPTQVSASDTQSSSTQDQTQQSNVQEQGVSQSAP